MSYFNDIQDDGVESTGDFLGGGGRLQTDVYEGTIKVAYAGKSSGGARSVTLLLDINGTEHRFTEYVTNRNGQTYYERNGKKNALAGFQTINELCLISTGKPMKEQTVAEKQVKIYDFEERKEIPTAVPVLMDLTGKSVLVAITLVEENKNIKNDQGDYVPTDEVVERNEISKFFHPKKKITVTEAENSISEPTFLPTWLEKNKGKTRNRVRTDGVVRAGSPSGSNRGNTSSAGAEKAKNLFSDD